MTLRPLRLVAFSLLLAFVFASVAWIAPNGQPNPTSAPTGVRAEGHWASDPVWHDGLVEKATYEAEMVLYGRPRKYEAIFLTNKEQHDAATWTKDADGEGELVEVWKHNQIEVVPTPNYEYKFVTTSHLKTSDLSLTRLDASSQEWCGASFKQFQRQTAGGWDYAAFSYMPEAGRQAATVADAGQPVVPLNALPLWLRGYDFRQRPPIGFLLVPNQKSNRPVPHEPLHATVRFVEESADGYVLELVATPHAEASREARIGLFTFAMDRNHVMLAYTGADGQQYRLKALEREDYWTRSE